MAKISEVIRSYQVPASSDEKHARNGIFWSVILLSEILGPLVGWPTLTGNIYLGAHYNRQDPPLTGMLELLIPQYFFIWQATQNLKRTTWAHWAQGRIKQGSGVILPEVNGRAVVLGLVFGVIAAWLISALLGGLPVTRGPLQHAELFLLALAVFVVAVVTMLHPKKQAMIDDGENQIYWVIPRSSTPVELMLDPTTFANAVVLRRIGSVVERCNPRDVIRPHTAEDYLLLNFGVFSDLRTHELEATSANAFVCKARFSLEIAAFRADGRANQFDAGGVQEAIHRLYSKQGSAFETTLTEQLHLALCTYAGDFDAEVQSAVERYRLGDLRQMSASARATVASNLTSATSGLSSATVSAEQLSLHESRIQNRLAELEAFQRCWEEARLKQRKAGTELLPVFDRQIRAFVKTQIRGNTAAEETVDRLMDCVQVCLSVGSLKFTETANECDRLLLVEQQELKAEQSRLEEKLANEKSDRANEIRAIMDQLIAKFDPALLMTTRGNDLFQRLLLARTAPTESTLKSLMSDFEALRSASGADGAVGALPGEHIPLPGPVSPAPNATLAGGTQRDAEDVDAAT